MELEPLPMLTAISWNIQFHPFTLGIAISLLVIMILLVFSALISGSEVAYFSLSPSEKHKINIKSTKRNSYTSKNLESPEHLLATILVANNFVNVGIVILSSFTVHSIVDFSAEPILGFIVQVFVISFVILLFGEIIPKVYTTHHALKFARFVAIPMNYLMRFLKPFNSVLIYSTSFINNRIHAYNKHLSVDELSQALELTSQIEMKEDNEILKGIVKFGNKSVAEIMRSRVDVVAADITDSYSKIVTMITETGFSRIPVFSETFDHIKGILYIKDLLPHVLEGSSFNWQSIIRPPFYVPETKKIDDLLEEFQKNKVHMAIVVDEYGGSSGIVTLEDILEEIVGEISDEFDEESKFFTKINENKYIFDGKTMLNDFYKITDAEDTIFDDVKGDADTLAGLILELKGEFPVKNDIINCKNYVFSIEAVDNRRIKQIKVEIKKMEQ
ncbi:MAG TPA: gliding motility-associated protein GldE [Prolixibacteraceae bacterium]|nr:gliding motility-associated protein GldE [Prolixibacteraceae bacterium]